jgi:hypothetical protein
MLKHIVLALMPIFVSLTEDLAVEKEAHMGADKT